MSIDNFFTWQQIAKIINIYESELADGNISRYGTAKDVRPTCERILEKYKQFYESKSEQ